jgi:hypothetical protein
MPRKPEAKRSSQPVLATQYRAIGSAAIAAALLHATKKKKPVQKFLSPRVA